MELVEHALEYAAQGVPVFPCKRNKSPHVRRGFHAATVEPLQITAWWAEFPEALIGAAILPGQLVLDVDPRNGGLDTIRSLIAHDRQFPVTRKALTGSGGWHFWYETDLPVEETKSILGNGVDVKRAGKGYVILPPSVSNSGEYVWLYRYNIARLPQWMKQQLRRPAPLSKRGPVTVKELPEGVKFTPYGDAALKAEAYLIRHASAGERNNVLNRGAFVIYQLVYGGELEVKYATHWLLEAAAKSGMSRTEAIATLESALIAAEKSPRVAPVEDVVDFSAWATVPRQS